MVELRNMKVTVIATLIGMLSEVTIYAIIQVLSGTSLVQQNAHYQQ